MDNNQCLAVYTTANDPTHQCRQRAAPPTYQFCSRHVALVRQYVLNEILDTTPILTLMVSEDGSFIKQIEFGDEMRQDGYTLNEGRDADELSMEEGYADHLGHCDDPDCDDPGCIREGFDHDYDDPYAMPRRYAYEDRESDWGGSAGSGRRHRGGRDGGNDSRMSDGHALPRYPPVRRGYRRNLAYGDRYNGRNEENGRDREPFASASSASFDSSSVESFDSSSSGDSFGSSSSSGSDSHRSRHPRQPHGRHPDNNPAHDDTPDYDSEYSDDDTPSPATPFDNENYPAHYPFYPYPYPRRRGPTGNGGSRYRLGSARDAYAQRRSRSPVGDGYRGNGLGERRRPPSVDLGYRRYD